MRFIVAVAIAFVLITIVCVGNAGATGSSSDNISVSLTSPVNLIYNSTYGYYEYHQDNVPGILTVNITVNGITNVSEYGVKRSYTIENHTADIELADLTGWAGYYSKSGTGDYLMAYGSNGNTFTGGINTSLFKITITGISFTEGQLETITLPVEIAPKSTSAESPDDTVIKPVVIKLKYMNMVTPLTLVSYNGYVKDKAGNYLKNASTGLNITDVLTGDELAAPGIQTPDDQRFNASIKSEMVYSCGKEASVGGNISVVNQYPKFYSISGANITLETVVVEAFNSAGGCVASSTSASIVDGKLHHDCDLTDPSISYLNITFTGRKLGDVDNNSELTPNDSTEMYQSFVETIVLTNEDIFYADTDQTCELTPNDCVVIFQYLIESHMYSWI